MSIVTEGSSVAGLSYTLVCMASRTSTLSLATMEIEWIDLQGNVVISNENIVISGPNSTTEEMLTSRLTFNSLRTSSGGTYTCQVNMTIPTIVRDHPVTRSQDVRVKRKFSITLTKTSLSTVVSLWYMLYVSVLKSQSQF